MKVSDTKMRAVFFGAFFAACTMFIAPHANACNSIGMTVYNYLDRGQSFGSNGMLIAHQSDGNVVAYSNGMAVWATGTSGRATTRFVFQGDGNLVLYGPNGPLWQSGMSGIFKDFFGMTQPCGQVSGIVGMGNIYYPSRVGYFTIFSRF
jgi:hypothetical protein